MKEKYFRKMVIQKTSLVDVLSCSQTIQILKSALAGLRQFLATVKAL